MEQTQIKKQAVAYYPKAQPTVRITPVTALKEPKRLPVINDLQGAFVASVGDLPTARYMARCINSYERLLAEVRAVAEGATRTEHCRALLAEIGEE